MTFYSTGTFLENYSPVGDVITAALTILFAILLNSAYTVKERNLTIFKFGEVSLAIASLSSIVYHMIASFLLTAETIPLIYLFRDITYIMLSLVNTLFLVYLVNLFGLPEGKKRPYLSMILAVYVLYAAAQILEPFLRFGFYIGEDLTIRQITLQDPFLYCYIFLAINIMGLFVQYRKKLVKRMSWTLFWTMALVAVISLTQVAFHQTSFTSFTYALPLIAVLFMFHYNAYDIATGMLDAKSFPSYIAEQKKKKKRYGMVWLRLIDISLEQMFLLTEEFYHFTGKFFGNTVHFRMRDDKMVMLYEYKKPADRDRRMVRMLEAFGRLYDTYRIDFKIQLMEDLPELETGEDYMGLADYMENRMADNEVRTANRRDVDGYLESRFILTQLREIHLKKDPEDDRVQVYCQPVLNTKEEMFSTAEALMRLKLPGYGIVPPDRFIPLAEKSGYIHDLTKIMLSKVCASLKNILDRGYTVERISINVSVTELRIPRFTEDIKEIVRSSGVPFDRIAIELTETKNETDFAFAREVMNELREVGMLFYLDDFGTGYSNFERILGLPIDIIKFDRSMTRLASSDKNTKYLVSSFAHIFRDCGYSVLFEGVEDRQDEEMCEEMEALYLQGYKYSKPVPVEELPDFLERD